MASMLRTHWGADEFKKMFEPAERLAFALGADDEEAAMSRDAALSFWLMFIAVGGHA